MEGLRLAFEKGYRILEIYDVYECQVTQYNPETGECRLLVAYMNTFFKQKAEASGYPGRVPSPENEDR